jgi:hypothetical protein
MKKDINRETHLHRKPKHIARQIQNARGFYSTARENGTPWQHATSPNTLKLIFNE